jgi:hypothetical protein
VLSEVHHLVVGLRGERSQCNCTAYVEGYGEGDDCPAIRVDGDSHPESLKIHRMNDRALHHEGFVVDKVAA